MIGPDPQDTDFDAFEWDDILEQMGGEAPADPMPSPQAAAPKASAKQTPKRDSSSKRPAKSSPPPEEVSRRTHRRESDPLFIYAVLVAFSVGLTPLAASDPIGRYTILWTLMTGFGLAGLLLNRDRYTWTITLQDVMWGGGFGLVLGLPLLLVGSQPLAQASEQLFTGLPDGAVFQSVVFVMSTAETMFFRGVVQLNYDWPVTAGMAALWSILLFFPTLDLWAYPMIAVIIGTFIVMLSLLYSYVRQRNNLPAAWISQMVVSVMWLFLPRLFV